MSDSACLAGDTAAADTADDVELTCCAGNAEGLVYDELESFKPEIIVNVTSVDGDHTCAGDKTNSGYRALSISFS